MLCHPSHGFALLGCVFSLPKAILHWSAVVAVGEAAFVTMSAIHIRNSTMLLLLVVLAIFTVSSGVVLYTRRKFPCAEQQETCTPSGIEGRV